MSHVMNNDYYLLKYAPIALKSRWIKCQT